MGAVFSMFFAPLILVGMFFSTLVGTAIGPKTTEVELPYNPEEGYVWEFECVGDEYLLLIDTEIEGDKQVFTFRGKHPKELLADISTEKINGAPVYFIAKNGEKLLYYTRNDYDSFIDIYGEVIMYEPGEYVFAEYTPKETKTVEGAEWEADTYENENYVETIEVDGVKTYKFVILPDEEGSTYSTAFRYRNRTNDVLETYAVTFGIVDGQGFVLKETHRMGR